MTADETRNALLNVGGTQNAVDLANDLGAGRFHHISSIAVAGSYEGLFTEDDFDEGQQLPTPTTARSSSPRSSPASGPQAPWRVYRPAIVVGHSKTGEMDKIDGPYYFFKAIQKLRHALPPVVPARRARVRLDQHRAGRLRGRGDGPHRPPADGLDGQAFHLVDPKQPQAGDVINAFANAAHAPQRRCGSTRSSPTCCPKGVLGDADEAPGAAGHAQRSSPTSGSPTR